MIERTVAAAGYMPTFDKEGGEPTFAAAWMNGSDEQEADFAKTKYRPGSASCENSCVCLSPIREWQRLQGCERGSWL
ncbi:hypothetical protein N8I71_16830 [Roseibacterium sp. SDUM158016]|uniref:hypothetical protein n=1 Tax=Roseicyclus sediminis TaxID=2980997 RepID=UPI0021D0FD25|nr:hypothetical protein [Roseibacterium sp. SDUM158016]MCU4654507.1 hypothetical protein [Roseibacterium sp. SDUM158016]